MSEERRPVGLLSQLKAIWAKLDAGGAGGIGPKGDKGDTGEPGDDGLSAYEVAVANGFVGTEPQWLASLQGADGEAGADSTVPGPQGAPGEPGADGSDANVTNANVNTAIEANPGATRTSLQLGTAAQSATGAFAPAAHVGSGGSAHANAVAAGAAGFMTGADKTKLDGIASGATANDTDVNLKARANHTGTQSLDTTTDSATRLAMTAAERTKLTGVATGATANATDAQLRDRSTHTGTQAASTISDFSEAVDDRVAALISPAGTLSENYDDAGNLLTLTATSGGGADPWTYIKLANDFTTSSATAVDITGMGFTPAANKAYEFEGRLRLRTATATVGARPGLAWPTGFTDGAAEVRVAISATAEINAFGNPNAALLAAGTALANTTQSWPAYVGGEIQVGASPSGTVKLQLASETAGTNVTCKAGSWLRYREIP